MESCERRLRAFRAQQSARTKTLLSLAVSHETGQCSAASTHQKGTIRSANYETPREPPLASYRLLALLDDTIVCVICCEVCHECRVRCTNQGLVLW
eukprot:6358031-Amphidinium_carterae.2